MRKHEMVDVDRFFICDICFSKDVAARVVLSETGLVQFGSEEEGFNRIL